MGSWRKVGAFLGLVPDDGRRDEFDPEYGPEYDGQRDYQDDDRDGYDRRGYQSQYATDEYGPDEYQRDDQGYEAPAPPRRGGYEPVTHGALAVQPEIRHPESTGAVRPVTIKLTGFSEARVIGEKYRDGKPVILDMTEMDDSDARRLVDFAAGLAFALRGSIDKVTTKVFMLLPADTDASDYSSYEAAAAQTGFTAGFGAEMSGRGRALAGARGR